MVQDVVLAQVSMYEMARLVQSPDNDDHFCVEAAHALRGEACVPQPGRSHAVVPDELHDKDVEAELKGHGRIDPSLEGRRKKYGLHDGYDPDFYA